MPPLSPGAAARSSHPGMGWVQMGPCSSLCSPTTPPQELYCSPPLPYSFQTGDSSTLPLSINLMASRYILTYLFTHSQSLPPFPAHPAATGRSTSQPAFLSPFPCISSSSTCLSSSLVPQFLFAKLTTPILVLLEWLKNLQITLATDFENFSRNPVVLERNN